MPPKRVRLLLTGLTDDRMTSEQASQCQSPAVDKEVTPSEPDHLSTTLPFENTIFNTCIPSSKSRKEDAITGTAFLHSVGMSEASGETRRLLSQSGGGGRPPVAWSEEHMSFLSFGVSDMAPSMGMEDNQEVMSASAPGPSAHRSAAPLQMDDQIADDVEEESSEWSLPHETPYSGSPGLEDLDSEELIERGCEIAIELVEIMKRLRGQQETG
ncbi:hypothetical protein EDB89DRAFT_2074558 [Lactarius sanguifluus]|nr:hypothetical protein EDB89DRAFT_2074558 [Lactarius sanguifluus]